MDPTTVPTSFYDTMLQHLSPGSTWMPVGGALVAAFVGLVFMIKGARLAPVLAALVFAACGAAGAAVLAYMVSLPFWPAVVVGTTIGLVLGVVLFRLWFAILVALCMMTGGLAVYTGQALTPALQEYQVRGLRAGGLEPGVTLPEAPTTQVTAAAWQAELSNVWSYLDQHVRNFQVNLYTVAIVTALAGLIFGLLLPRASRALWAATTGTVLFVPAFFALVHAAWPLAAGQFGPWLGVLAALFWSLSFILNLADVLNWRPRKTAPRSGGSPT